MEETRWGAALEYCSYPTYEEWKHHSLSTGFSKSLSVLILPMRNGNLVDYFHTFYTYQSSYPTYEEWKLSQPYLMAVLNSVLILPMRNGNKRIIQVKLMLEGSYPTYEEWKLIGIMK